ncbi:sensor histidine kinase [Enterococcus sp. LJL51]|uniref:sensor histidine kinase n=1 Tax=Enterococcus sp. LJL51 TaxID=3416656 RepID=UPI003CF9E8FC
MRNNMNPVRFIPMGILFSIIVYFIERNYYLTGKTSIDDFQMFNFQFIIGVFSMFLGCLVLLKSQTTKVTKAYFWLTLLMGGIFQTLSSTEPLLIYLERIFVALSPVVMFHFFTTFITIDEQIIVKRLRTVLLLFSGFSLLMFLTNFYINEIYVIGLVLAVSFSIYSYFKFKGKQRYLPQRFSRLLLKSAVLSFFPYIFSVVFEMPKFSNNLAEFLILFCPIFILPTTIAYILIKNNTLIISTNYTQLLKKVLLIVVLLATNSVVLSFQRVSLEQQLLLNSLLLMMLFVYQYVSELFSIQEIEKIDKMNENLEAEKLKIFHQITYEDYFSSLGDLVTELVNRTVETDGLMIIWKDQMVHFILKQEGCFNDFVLNKEWIKTFQTSENIIIWHKNSYLFFELFYNNQIQGWLVLGKQNQRYRANEVSSLKLLSETVSELLGTSELLNQVTSKVQKLPQIKYDQYIQFKILYSNERIQKDFTYYLHDDILQNLLAIKNIVSTMEDGVVKDFIIENVVELNTSIREKMFDIYPSMLANMSLQESLGIYCEKLRKDQSFKNKNIKIKYVYEESIYVPKEYKFTVFRAVKELIQNAVKHANANEIVLEISQLAETVKICITDDGVGFNVKEKIEENFYTNHIGLLSVKQDINAIKGDIQIRSKEKSGTAIEMMIPIGERSGENENFND